MRTPRPSITRRDFSLGLAQLLVGIALSSPCRAFASDSDTAATATGDKAELIQHLAPNTQTIAFQTTKRPVVVKGSPYTGTDLKRRLRSLRLAVRDFEETGGHVGLVIHDLGTGASITYAKDDTFYPASSIKGPYVNCLYECRETGSLTAKEDKIARLAEPTIVISDNDTYLKLRELYGNQVFTNWCLGCGAITKKASNYKDLANEHYPVLTPAQLARMWEHSFDYFDAGSKDARQLLGFYAKREESPLRDAIPTADMVIAKAGWYPLDDGKEYAATVDAGIVLQGDHSYIVAIMTNAPAELDLLRNMTSGIFGGRRALL